MTAPSLTKKQIAALKPCTRRWEKIAPDLPDGPLTVAKAREYGATFDDLVWVVSAARFFDEDVKRRVQLWMADCAARVAHLAKDKRVDDCIVAVRAFARGKLDAASDSANGAKADAVSAAYYNIITSSISTSSISNTTSAVWDAAWAAASAASASTARDSGSATSAASAAAWAASASAAKAASAAARAASIAWAAAKAANVARATEEEWQFNRLVAWFSDDEPEDWPIAEWKSEETA